MPGPRLSSDANHEEKATMKAGSTYYAHFPKLVVPIEGIDVLGGRIEPFRFEDFERMDADWARK